MDSIKLSREELYEMVWSKPMMHLAPELGISDRGLAKTCTRLEIPVPGRGYWQKIERGQQVEKEELPPLSEGCQPYAWFYGPSEKPEPIVVPEAGIIKEAQEFEAKASSRIVVPDSIRRYHPLVQRTLDLLLEAPWDRQELYRSHGERALDLSCTKESAHRAARIYHVLIQSFEKRGYSISVDPGYSHDTYVECFDEKIKISMREKLMKVPIKRRKGESPSMFGNDPKFAFVPSGRLTLRIDIYPDSHKHLADEDGNPLEERLNDFMVRLAKAAVYIKYRKIERERREREWEEKRLAEEKLKQQAAMEKTRRDDLDRLVANWLKARQIREFIEAVQPLPLNIPYDDMDKEQWLTWASEYANKLDPFFLRSPSPLT